MKYIPLTQHFQTVAMLYEKCADLSSQIDSLQSQIQNNNGQIENEEVEKQPQIMQEPTSKVPEKQYPQPQIDKDSQQNAQIEEEKQNQDKSILKISKSIEKSIKMKVSLTCDHCNKIFQTERQYKKHRYGIKYRGSKDKSKKNSQIDQQSNNQSELKEIMEEIYKKESPNQNSFETFQILL
ncbi:unnamed protein product [Paramecium primaurelia]|uniref:C2H2-type domain-containing protein n=1 Tax=Paramecium primaurelia TaxID=5886 RepID=A0A8S1JLS8_PARPR|nr:unnamed protein product [Paramecium primaurelia]